MAGLFELHDRSGFEIVGFFFGSPPVDAMHKRLQAAFDQFISIDGLSDDEAVGLARSMAIDIAVDLKGLTGGSRPGLFARRMAPVQVSYIGYPCTMGASFIDYLIADKVLIADDDLQFYSEKSSPPFKHISGQ